MERILEMSGHMEERKQNWSEHMEKRKKIELYKHVGEEAGAEKEGDITGQSGEKSESKKDFPKIKRRRELEEVKAKIIGKRETSRDLHFAFSRYPFYH